MTEGRYKVMWGCCSSSDDAAINKLSHLCFCNPAVWFRLLMTDAANQHRQEDVWNYVSGDYKLQTHHIIGCRLHLSELLSLPKALIIIYVEQNQTNLTKIQIHQYMWTYQQTGSSDSNVPLKTFIKKPNRSDTRQVWTGCNELILKKEIKAIDESSLEWKQQRCELSREVSTSCRHVQLSGNQTADTAGCCLHPILSERAQLQRN